MKKLLKIARWAFFVLFVGLTLTGAHAFITPKLTQWRGLERKRDELIEQIEQKKKQINTMKENQQRFKTDRDFVERIAREDRRVQPGELVFVFDKNFR